MLHVGVLTSCQMAAVLRHNPASRTCIELDVPDRVERQAWALLRGSAS
jgi:hypothetical protein